MEKKNVRYIGNITRNFYFNSIQTFINFIPNIQQVIGKIWTYYYEIVENNNFNYDFNYLVMENAAYWQIRLILNKWNSSIDLTKFLL